jgi:hypothetical protein
MNISYVSQLKYDLLLTAISNLAIEQLSNQLLDYNFRGYDKEQAVTKVSKKPATSIYPENHGYDTVKSGRWLPAFPSNIHAPSTLKKIMLVCVIIHFGRKLLVLSACYWSVEVGIVRSSETSINYYRNP